MATHEHADGMSASWHPALRPNDAQDLQQIQSTNSSSEAVTSVSPHNSLDTLPSQEIGTDKSEEDTPHETHMPGTTLNAPSTRISLENVSVPATTEPSHHAIQTSEYPSPKDDDAIFHPDESAATQQQKLDNFETHAGIAHDDELDNVVTASAASDEAHHPEEAYEHQSTASALDLAVDEGPEIPLLDDEESMPTPGVISRGATFEHGFGTALQGGEEANILAEDAEGSAVDHPSFDRSFTTNFVEETGNEILDTHEHSRQRSLQIDNDWPAAGDDKTFAALLGNDEPAPVQSQSKQPLHGNTMSQDWSVAGEDSVFDEIITQHQPLSINTGESQLEVTDDLSLMDDDLLPDDENEGNLAAAWQAALDDDDLLDADTNAVDPSSFFGDDDGLLDDEGFLEDEPDDTFANLIQQKPVVQDPRPSAINAYQPSVPQSVAHGRAAGTPDTGLTDVFLMTNQLKSQTTQSAQSFADKAKGGYQSPYDLPMEVVKPRRRPQALQPTSSATPPSRSSSFPGQQIPESPMVPGTPRGVSSSILPTPDLKDSTIPPPNGTPRNTGTMPPPPSRQESGFFADLPMKQKPRNRASGNFGPTPIEPIPSPVQRTGRPASTISISPRPPSRIQAQYAPQTSKPSGELAQDNVGLGLALRQPDRMPLYPENPTDNQKDLPLPSEPSAVTSRYSPAPTAQAAANRTRYGPVAASTAHAFAPRTSSPLAYQADLQNPETRPDVNINRQSYQIPSTPERKDLASLRYTPHETASPQQLVPGSNAQPSPQKSQTRPTAPRSQRSTYERTISDISANNILPQRGPALPHRRKFSKDITFIAPHDVRSQDPLERWKGGPIFQWGPNGSVAYSFPQHTPMYASGQPGPSLKCTAGNIILQDTSTVLPLSDHDVKFPGPLPAKSKGKKKDVLAWLSSKIEVLQQNVDGAREDFTMPVDTKKRLDEKLILWKTVKIMVEHDGQLEGDGKLASEMRAILLPDLAQMNSVIDLQTPVSISAQSDASDKTALFQVRQALLEGDRERAVLIAEEKKMWGHAMLISSTMGHATWKQIVQSFVRSEVKPVGSDARSLAALYQVFGGNSDDVVDELVPASARAGFRMVSKGSGIISTNPLEGLDQWRETLGLIIGNRTSNEGPSLVSLGKLLADYGRPEAGHTCLLFGRKFAKHSGADDSEASFVLLGTSCASHPDANFGTDLDSILLTEVYEWVCSLNAVNYVPHLQAYKLIHAQMLAAHGQKAKAQAYCDHITSAYTTTTTPSPYYHPTFTQAVTDLSTSLSQTTDGKGGFFRKPAMNKVSSGAASWFTKFVAGDEDRDAAAENPALAGPFGGVSEHASISRVTSDADLYDPMASQTSLASATGPYAPAAASGRYAPSNYGSGSPAQPIPMDHTASNNLYTPQHGSVATPGTSPAGSSVLSPGLSNFASPPQSWNGSGSADVSFPKRNIQSPARPISASSRYAPSPGSGASIARPNSRPTQEYSPALGGLRRGSSQLSSQISGAGYMPAPLLAAEQSSVTYPDYGNAYSPERSGSPVRDINQPAETNEPLNNSFAQPPAYGSNGSAHHNDYHPYQNGTGASNPSYTPMNPNHDSNGGEYTPFTSSYQPTQTTDEPYGFESGPPVNAHEEVNGKAEDAADTFENGNTTHHSADNTYGGYAPPSGGYEPPTSGYQPYEPEEPEPEHENVGKPKPKKSFMDDDDDDGMIERAASVKKVQEDRQADEAFRKAAEADAARDNAKGGGDKKGWFGGWFGGNKDPNVAPGPVRAKLGEENSFYYDENLKKWVNKKGGSESATPVAATPPPPKGPPGRMSAMGPPSGPPSRVVSAAGLPPMGAASRPLTSAPILPPSGPPSRAGTPAAESAGMPPSVAGIAAGDVAMRPPSRPATGMSNANSLDDLLGGPPGAGGRRGGTVKGKKKGGRYVDVMAK